MAPLPQHATPTDAETRRGLAWSIASQGFNSVFAYITFGSSVFVLFMSELGLPKSHIGMLLSLFPFCGIVAPVLASRIARFGYKRTYLLFYGIRKFIMLGLLLAPGVLALFGPRWALICVTAVILIFAICRAIAETGFYPWFQEFVPDAIRGKFGALSSVVATLIGIIALAGASYVLKYGVGLQRFNILIIIGVVFGLLGVLTHAFVPGGAAVPSMHSDTAHGDEMRAAWQDGSFRRFLTGMSCVLLGSVVVAFLPLFMKEQVGIQPEKIVLLDTGILLGGLLSGYFWGWAADRFGGKPILIIGVAMMAALPLCWLCLPRHTAWSFAIALGIAVLWGAANMGNAIGSTPLLFNAIIPPQQKTGYTAIWYAWSGIIGGIGPLLSGHILDSLKGMPARLFNLPIDAYTPFFLVCSGLLIIGAFVYRTVPGIRQAPIIDRHEASEATLT
ncbi:MAG: MFS transporter [Armatimonadota bacterium]